MADQSDQDPSKLPSWRTTYSTEAAAKKVAGENSVAWTATFVVRNLNGGKTGNFTMTVVPHWAPVGARRFRRLLEENFYDKCRLFRVISGFVAQFGISADPETSAEWQHKTIADDIVKFTNSRGRVSFATSGQDTRSTQLFISLTDNRFLDKQGFSPFAEITDGMETIDQLFHGYGEGPPAGQGPDQRQIQSQGNVYLARDFPLLSYVEHVEFSPNGQPLGEAARAEDFSGVASRLGTPLMIVFPLLVVACICMVRIGYKVCRMFCEDDDDKSSAVKVKGVPHAQVLGCGPAE